MMQNKRKEGERARRPPLESEAEEGDAWGILTQTLSTRYNRARTTRYVLFGPQEFLLTLFERP